MSDELGSRIAKDAGRYFSDAAIKQFLEEIARWSSLKGRTFYQISQEGNQPIFVVAQLEQGGMYNFVMLENRTAISFVPFESVVLTDFYKAKDRSILRVHHKSAVRPNQYFEYVSYDGESERRLFLFSKALVGYLKRESHNE